MEVSKTFIPDLLVIESTVFSDGRGHFFESWNSRQFLEAGICLDFVQDNQSLSTREGTVRGLHFQLPPFAQAKLVRCVSGRVYDVAVDIRNGSPTFGRWFGIELSPEKFNQLLVPVGFLHGFMTLEPLSEVVYKCSDYYAPSSEGCVAFDDSELGIKWPDTGTKLDISAKDRAGDAFKELDSPFYFESVG